MKRRAKPARAHKNQAQYSKPDALEFIFNAKFAPHKPQAEIPFTREEVRQAIEATGGTVPDNLNNFVKDLTRTGNPNPRSRTAKKRGYLLREGTHSDSMGVFFLPSSAMPGQIAVLCPPELNPEQIPSNIPPEIIDILRPDEGGLLAALESAKALDRFFEVPAGSVRKVQSPVKVQPHELDSFFLLVQDGLRTPIACEAKSRGNDQITLNQIVGVAAATLQRLLEPDMDQVIPLGVKLLDNGDIFVVSFPPCTIDDLMNLQAKLTASSVVRRARYRLVPVPTKWR